MAAFFAQDAREWLEADGLGGFASGTVSGIRTRRYHALLLYAATPPTGRIVLVNGLETYVETPGGRAALSSQRYAPDVLHPNGVTRIEQFEPDPWPRWLFQLEDGSRIEQSVFTVYGSSCTVVAWKRVKGHGSTTLVVRPLLSGRDYHALHHENPDFRFDAVQKNQRVTWQPYPGLPGIVAWSNGTYTHQPDWYRNFLYEEERARGLDHTEDLASPGVFRWDIARGIAVLILFPSTENSLSSDNERSITDVLERFRADELKRRRKFPSRLERAADAYLVQRGTGQTIVAGYPWFTDWGRDTFIALRGLCLATGRLREARNILMEWVSTISQGMLPNRFPDSGSAPEYNSVDASLWYVIAIDDYFRTMKRMGRAVSVGDRRVFRQAIDAILSGYAAGTRHGIRLAADGLLAAGEPGMQLTWMDAKVGDWVVTPRIGKPVEVEALWLNALWIGSTFSERWEGVFARGQDAFRERFWNAAHGCLYDVIDVDHQPGNVDASLRPNQIFAVGGLPLTLINGEHGRQTVEMVERRLWTPMGLRSLAPEEAGYTPRYNGGVRERDGAYHQGTAWPWLIGPFVEAWLRVHGNTAQAKRKARERFLAPLLRHLDDAGLGHISEIADAEAPYTPRGCPFQAWSVGEALRLSRAILTEDNFQIEKAGTHGKSRRAYSISTS